jgi:hypothetical protein
MRDVPLQNGFLLFRTQRLRLIHSDSVVCLVAVYVLHLLILTVSENALFQVVGFQAHCIGNESTASCHLARRRCWESQCFYGVVYN